MDGNEPMKRNERMRHESRGSQPGRRLRFRPEAADMRRAAQWQLAQQEAEAEGDQHERHPQEEDGVGGVRGW